MGISYKTRTLRIHAHCLTALHVSCLFFVPGFLLLTLDRSESRHKRRIVRNESNYLPQ